MKSLILSVLLSLPTQTQASTAIEQAQSVCKQNVKVANIMYDLLANGYPLFYVYNQYQYTPNGKTTLKLLVGLIELGWGKQKILSWMGEECNKVMKEEINKRVIM